ncbi:MAG: DUF1801 domain-containing protein [Lysobacteraceae bacterium]
MTPFKSNAVATKFDSYPLQAKEALLGLRELIFDVAGTTPDVGDIEETLKWDEPAYVTPNRSGTTIRMDWKAKRPDEYALYFHCRTNLIETFRTMFPNDFVFAGNRALVFRLDTPIPEDAVRTCIAAALTYHRRKETANNSV